MLEYIALALSLPASTYSYGENNCGDPGSPRVCAHGAVTASGEALHSNIPSAAVPAPVKQRMRVKEVGIRHTVTKECVFIRVNDKANARWVGKRGLDMTPAALKAIGIVPTKHWSGNLEVCGE